MSERFGLIGSEEHALLADVLGEEPETLVPVHILRRNLSRAYVVGDTRRFGAAVIQERDYPAEVMGFGPDVEALVELLEMVEGWSSVEIEDDLASDLGTFLERQTGGNVCYYGSVFHTLTRPVVPFIDEAVRLLTPDDLELLEVSGDMGGSGWGSFQTLLEDGVMAGAVQDGRLVANAFTAARSQKYADIATNTLEGLGGRGLATAGASLVAREIQQAGQTPVWECGEEHQASMRMARKLGFAPVSRKSVIVQETGVATESNEEITV